MKYAIIVAGGVGSRSGDSLPKQFHDICGRPMLWWSLRAFHEEDPATGIIVVMHPDYIDMWRELCGDDCPKHTVVAGGATRTLSVLAGLNTISDDEEGEVAVHDAARPLVSREVIRKGFEMAREYDAVIPAVPMAESLREGTPEKSVAVDRNRYFIVQTPQIFGISLLKRSYTEALKDATNAFTDDASVAEYCGHRVRMYEGDPMNIKVTYPGDFMTAAARLSLK